MDRLEGERPNPEVCARCGLRRWTRELEQRGTIIRFCAECYWGAEEDPEIKTRAA